MRSVCIWLLASKLSSGRAIRIVPCFIIWWTAWVTELCVHALTASSHDSSTEPTLLHIAVVNTDTIFLVAYLVRSIRNTLATCERFKLGAGTVFQPCEWPLPRPWHGTARQRSWPWMQPWQTRQTELGTSLKLTNTRSHRAKEKYSLTLIKFIL